MYSKAAVLSLALTAAAAPTAPTAPEPVSVPFQSSRRSFTHANGDFDHVTFLRHFNDTLAKYKAPSRLPTFNFAAGNQPRANLPLTDVVNEGTIDELYYGPITVGGQTGFTVDFDTGSADLFVPGPDCSSSDGCAAGGVRYKQGGQNRNKQTSVTYGSGAISGNDYLDTVTVAGLSASDVNVISLTNAQGFSGNVANSLMGMGFSTISNAGGPTYFENLMKQGKAQSNEFSFFLGRAVSNTQGQSQLTIGGRDSSKFTGAVTKVPVTQKGYWQVSLDSINYQGNAISNSGGQAAIDTGTTIVLGPTKAVAALWAQIPGSVPIQVGGGENIYGFPCNSPPQLSLSFNGQQFKINTKDLSLGVVTQGFASMLGDNKLWQFIEGIFGLGKGKSSQQLCAGTIAGADIMPGENFWIVGDTFLKNWYSIYSYDGPYVGFAAAAGAQ